MLDEKIAELRKRGGEILKKVGGRMHIESALKTLLTELQIEGRVTHAISGGEVAHRRATITLNDGRNIDLSPFS